MAEVSGESGPRRRGSAGSPRGPAPARPPASARPSLRGGSGTVRRRRGARRAGGAAVGAVGTGAAGDCASRPRGGRLCAVPGSQPAGGRRGPAPRDARPPRWGPGGRGTGRSRRSAGGGEMPGGREEERVPGCEPGTGGGRSVCLRRCLPLSCPARAGDAGGRSTETGAVLGGSGPGVEVAGGARASDGGRAAGGGMQGPEGGRQRPAACGGRAAERDEGRREFGTERSDGGAWNGELDLPYGMRPLSHPLAPLLSPQASFGSSSPGSSSPAPARHPARRHSPRSPPAPSRNHPLLPPSLSSASRSRN